jgi:hypothetical protein
MSAKHAWHASLLVSILDKRRFERSVAAKLAKGAAIDLRSLPTIALFREREKCLGVLRPELIRSTEQARRMSGEPAAASMGATA